MVNSDTAYPKSGRGDSEIAIASWDLGAGRPYQYTRP